jgi:hypothetical protein
MLISVSWFFLQIQAATVQDSEGRMVLESPLFLSAFKRGKTAPGFGHQAPTLCTQPRQPYLGKA